MSESISKYSGVVVPMVTPFTLDGRVDEPAVGRIVDRLVGAKHGGVFALGTTGEAASIPNDEKRRMVAATVAATKKRAVVYAGIASNVFRDSVEAAKTYKEMGVDAVVAHVPSYYPINEKEIEAYFKRLADAVELPLLLYNIPQTTNHVIPLDVVDKLRSHPNVVALKDSSPDPERLTELFKRTGGRGGFPVLLGNSSQFTHGLKLGGVGLIPSGGHLMPVEYQNLFEAGMAKDWDGVAKWQAATDAAVTPYLKGKTIGQGLAVLKFMLEKQGICGRTMLPPLLDYSE